MAADHRPRAVWGRTLRTGLLAAATLGGFLAVLGTEAAATEASGCPATSEALAPALGELKVTYHGVSTLMFSDGRERLLVDGFFSRPNIGRMLFLPIGSEPAAVSEGLGKELAPVRAVLTAHAHHDHALDTAAVAMVQDEAVVVGTRSVARLVGARKVPSERICIPAEGAPMVFGPYRVTAFYVRHGPNPFFLRLLLDHPLNRTLSGSAWFGSYRDDENLSYLVEYGDRRILVHPSSGTPSATVTAPIVFLGMGRVGKMAASDARDYWRATVAPGATTVVPIHWDRFTTKLGKKLVPSPGLLDDVPEGRRRVCRYAAERPGLEMLRMESGAKLVITREGAVRGESGVTDFCV